MKKLLDRKEVPLAPKGENTYGLKVIRETHDVDGKTEVHWQYDLPDGCVVFGLTPDKKVIAIKKWRPGVGEYPQMPAENLEPEEIADLRAALGKKNDAAVEVIATRVARRCLLEETGYTAANVRLLTVLSQHSGKTPMVHCFCLAEGCTKTLSEGSGQKEEGIKLLPLADVARMWEMLIAYFNDRPTEAHGGKNSIVAMTLALQKLGALRVESVPEFRGAPTVVALRGLPLSGKTTLGKALARELGWTYIDVNSMREIATTQGRPDEVNPWDNGDTARRESEDMRIAYTLMHEAVRVNLELGRSVIISATYSRQTAQKFLLDIVKAHPGAHLKSIRLKFNDTDEEILRRIAARGLHEGFCATLEHYLDAKKRYDHADLWGVLEISTSQPLNACVAQALEFVKK